MKILKKIILIIGVLLGIYLISFMVFSIYAKDNETYFKTTYDSVNEQDIFIPKFSYFKEECCMTAATFHSLVPKFVLEKQIKNYLKDFTYFENEETYGYQKDDLFIQSYEVKERILYREIIIVY